MRQLGPRLREPRRAADGARPALRLATRAASVAAAITALMTGRAYRTSGEVAAAIGPVRRVRAEPRAAPARDAQAPRRRRTRSTSSVETDLLAAARRSWDEAVELGERHGHRNAQATVLAPTGTISFLMDCDTTGIEPDFSLVKIKELVGGGHDDDRQPHRAAGAARASATREAEIEQIEAYVNEHRTIVGAPGAEGRAPAGVRRGRRRARDLAHGPHQDDGRGAAVHLGRDLEDRQHAGRLDGRGHQGRLPRGRAARPEGARDLPRRLEDRAGAADRRAVEEGKEPTAEAADARSASACRASASRSRTSSRSPATRATSPPAGTRTARWARSS